MSCSACPRLHALRLVIRALAEAGGWLGGKAKFF